MDNSLVYLGETCVFDVTLSNQGAPVAALTIKVECSVEGGSTSVLYDNSQSPLQQLPFNAQEQLRVQTDVKEQGLITIVASAVFTDQAGERKYHVQFFKFSSASPVSVRTRVRHLPHTITAAATSSGSSSGASSSGCGVGKTRCFLEVNVQNSTQLAMQLHAVRLLAAPGVAALQIAALCSPQQHQQLLAQAHASSHQHADQQQQQQQAAAGKAPGHAQMAPAGASSSDTEMLQDIDSFSSSSASAAAAPSVQHKQQQQHGFNQSQQQHLQPPGQSGLAPFPGPEQQQQQVVPLPAGCSHNCLWQIDHQLAGSTATGGTSSSTSSSGAGGPPPPPAAAAGAAGPSSSGPISSGSSSSSSTLGRLELHWSTSDGRTGRLLTQPLTGPVPASGKEVLMQLHKVTPGPPAGQAAAAAVTAFSLQGPQQLAANLTVNQPFTATFTLTAGPHDMGPLLVLYTTTVAPAPSSSSTGGGLASTSSTSLATDSSSIQARRLGTAAAGDSACPEVVVQGSRSRRVTGLAAGQSVDVPFELLPLRCGWLRLPTFVVASEADGRLLDGVHDVHVLVA